MVHYKIRNVKMIPKFNETPQQIVKRFKKLVDRDGVTKELKKRAFYEKPSEIAKRKKFKVKPDDPTKKTIKSTKKYK